MNNNIENCISMVKPKCEGVFFETLGPLSYYGRFRISNLEKGQAQTMGVAIRRTLFRNIIGLRITCVFIVGAYHEYSTIPGVRECINDILANLKEIVFKGQSLTNLKGFISFKGPGIITSGDIIFPSNQMTIEILDKKKYIAKIETETTLKMDFIINSFKDSTEKMLIDRSNRVDKIKESESSLEESIFFINSFSSPIRNENHYIENSLTASTKENLMIEIWTNGSITPTEALNNALKTLSFIFDLTIE